MPEAVVPVVDNNTSVPQLIALAKVGLSVYGQVLFVAGQGAELKWIPDKLLMHYLFCISKLRDVAVMYCEVNDSYVAGMCSTVMPFDRLRMNGCWVLLQVRPFGDAQYRLLPQVRYERRWAPAFAGATFF